MSPGQGGPWLWASVSFPAEQEQSSHLPVSQGYDGGGKGDYPFALSLHVLTEHLPRDPPRRVGGQVEPDAQALL